MTLFRSCFLSALPLALALSTVACGAARPEPQTPASAGPAAPPPATRVSTQVITPGDVGTAAELFEKGKKLLLEEKYKEAAETFDLVQKGDPEGRLAPIALVHAGMAYEGAEERDTAADRYRQVIDKYPKDELVKVALLRCTRLLVAGEKWAELGTQAETLSQRADLTIPEAIHALGAKGLASIEQGDDEKASRFVERARDLMEKHHIGESGKIPHEVAQVYYALGEVRRVKSERLKFDPPPPNFGDVFEQRAQGLLDAQAAYTDTMRTTDPVWATMAGFRVGQLYQQLHTDVMVVKTPTNAKSQKDKQLFEGAVRLRYRVLLEKGLKMMDATLRMNERVGEANAWTTRAKEAKADLESKLVAENAAIKKLPISEADLKKLLEDLGNKRQAEKEAKGSAEKKP
jgi:tetratricopeptide (TPR) repeat protein